MKEKAVIEFPLQGKWRALCPPGHNVHALDFMKTDKKNASLHNGSLIRYLIFGIPVDLYYTWAEPIYAPCDCIAIQASDGWRDNTKTSLFGTIWIWFRATYLFRPKVVGGKIDIRPNAGNYVMLKMKSGEVVFMAHLRRGSVKVKSGQKIKTGELIAEVGNSGNTTAPHLHLNLFDQVNDLLKSKVIPFVFKKYLRKKDDLWQAVENAFPEKNELIQLTG